MTGQRERFGLVSSVPMQTIICPHCKSEIEISSALQHEVKEQLEKEYKQQIEKARIEEREKIEKKLKEDMEFELKKLEEEKKSKEERIDKLIQDLLDSNKKIEDLQQKDKERELENQKKLQEETQKIAEKIGKEESEKSQLKIAEMQKQLEDTKKALEEAQRKSSQVSQQLQGEVLELELEQLLRQSYPMDEIIAVGKGINGADIRHIVKSPGGVVCGVILWEVKRTKHWDDKWLSKLKDDLRAEAANVPVIVSMDLPKEAKEGMGLKENVWVCAPSLILPLAELLRRNLYDVAKQKHLMSKQTEKADLLYSYVISHEFQQQVERILEIHKDMQDQILKEKAALTRSWKQREEQIEKILLTTATIVGSMQGKIGSGTLQIKGLELLESGE